MVMNHSVYQVALASPNTSVGNCAANAAEHLSMIRKAEQAGCHFILFPQLSLTGYSCGDLFFNSGLREAALAALETLRSHSRRSLLVCIVGCPLLYRNRLYNTAVCIQNGSYVAVLPSWHADRCFSALSPLAPPGEITLGEQTVPFGNLILTHRQLRLAAVFPHPLPETSTLPTQGEAFAANRVNTFFGLGAVSAAIGQEERLHTHLQDFSARHHAALLFSSCGPSESTTDTVYRSHHRLYQNAASLFASSSLSFQPTLSVISFDLAFSLSDSIRPSPLESKEEDTPSPAASPAYPEIPIALPASDPFAPDAPCLLTPKPSPTPFFPDDADRLPLRCREIFDIQCAGLTKRLLHTQVKTLVIGISGGLDSSLALLVCHQTLLRLHRSPKEILAVTMPGFGTTDATYRQACALIKRLGCSFLEIPIQAACLQHFNDIRHDPALHDLTYENAQARERTQILMDLANARHGLVVGTGDLSELALGWATYNGDHLSMYGVNADIPKTLIRAMVQWAADRDEWAAVADILQSVVQTPISPELLPAPENADGMQRTEDQVGPYLLHDFFLYYFLRWGFSPSRIFFYAVRAFEGVYAPKTILHWLEGFCRRFLTQQFKRSCLPDGPQVGTVSLSPRGAFALPSDSDSRLWQQEMETLRRNYGSTGK